MNNWTQKVSQRLARHLQNGSTDHLITDIHRISTHETYLNASREIVARHAPHLACPSSLLRPGHAIAGIHPDSTPFFVYRDRHDNNLKAYVNQCRHRGSPLVKEGSASESVPLGRSVVCPYHAWAYDTTSGALRGVPGEKYGFPCLTKETHSLLPIRCVDAAGGIWIGGDSLVDRGFWSIEEVHSELETMLSLPKGGQDTEEEATSLISYREWTLKSNWQLLVETFLESYHVSALHRDTLNLVAHSNVMVTDVLDGRSFRMTVPLKNFPDSEEEASSPEESFFGQTTTTYFIFPNAAVVLFKRFAMLLSIEPRGASASRIQAWAVGHQKAPREDRDTQRRDFDSVIAGIEEDWECSVNIQSGLDALRRGLGDKYLGIVDEDGCFTYGLFEGCNVVFLQNVRKATEVLQKDAKGI